MQDGGLAFPGKRYEMLKIAGKDEKEEISVTHSGMSLRAWLAGKALSGILTTRDERGRCGFIELTAEKIATYACEQADAVIDELMKEEANAKD